MSIHSDRSPVSALSTEWPRALSSSAIASATPSGKNSWSSFGPVMSTVPLYLSIRSLGNQLNSSSVGHPPRNRPSSLPYRNSSRGKGSSSSGITVEDLLPETGRKGPPELTPGCRIGQRPRELAVAGGGMRKTYSSAMSSGTSTAHSRSAASGTASRVRSWVDARTTGAAHPSW